MTAYLSVFSPNAGKYGPEKTPYLDTFQTVFGIYNAHLRRGKNSEVFLFFVLCIDNNTSSGKLTCFHSIMHLNVGKKLSK